MIRLRQFVIFCGFVVAALACATASASERQLKPSQVQVGECVPPFIYRKLPAPRAAVHPSQAGVASNTLAMMPLPNPHVAFFSVDCNGDDGFFIGLNGTQYSLKTSDHKPIPDSVFPAGIYVGDGIAVVIRRGKLLRRTFDGPNSSAVLNEEYETLVRVTLGGKTENIRGIFRSGP